MTVKLPKSAYSSILEAVLRHAADHPDKLFMADDVHEISYGEFANSLKRLVSFFLKHGIAEGQRVLVETSQKISYFCTEFALQAIGAVFVPFAAKSTPEKFAYFRKKARADFMVVSDSYELEDDAPALRCSLIDEVVFSTHQDEAQPVMVYPGADTVSEILFTTGTTGLEKGIVLTHQNDIATAQNVAFGLNLKADNRELILAPLNHAYALRRCYANFLRGGSVILQENQIFVKDLFDKIERYKVNAIATLPSTVNLLFRLSQDKLGEYAEQLRYIQVSSAPLQPEDKRRIKRLLPDAELFNMYGSTESGISCVYEFNRHPDKPSCIGHPAINSEILIVDDDGQAIKSDREHTGTLACRSPANMQGYFGETVADFADVMRDGVVYSNDVAYFDEDGDIILLGRKGDIINVGGLKFSPNELEKIACDHPKVADCACIAIADKLKGQAPKIFVQLKAGVKKEQFDFQDLKVFMSQSLEHYKLPSEFEIIDKIPRTFKGSLMRQALRERENASKIKRV